MVINKDDLEAFGYYDYEWEKERQHDMTPMDMVKEYASVTGQKPHPFLYANLILEEYKEWFAEFDAGSGFESPENELKELADLVYVTFGYANTQGWDLMEALRRVHQNNLGRCYQPDGTIKRREDGKIEKNKDYPKVDLSDLV